MQRSTYGRSVQRLAHHNVPRTRCQCAAILCSTAKRTLDAVAEKQTGTVVTYGLAKMTETASFEKKNTLHLVV